MATGAAATAAGLAATAGCANTDAANTGGADGAGPGKGPKPSGSPDKDGSHGFDVKAENARPGNADWQVTKAGPARAIEGFADKVSVLPGESFGLHVSTTAPRFTVSAYRMGWYGGARARLVWRSEALPGARQPDHTVDAATRMVRTRWTRSATVETKDWPEGCYLLRLDAQGGEGQRFVPVTVRSAATTGRTVMVNAVATWQAYNRWGGYGSYDGPSGGYASRSLAVSFDRPYEYDDGAGLFLVYEAPLLALAERLGMPLAYTTTTDVAREKRLLEGASAVLSLGHDEYWSPEQRAHFTAARDSKHQHRDPRGQLLLPPDPAGGVRSRTGPHAGLLQVLLRAGSRLQTRSPRHRRLPLRARGRPREFAARRDLRRLPGGRPVRGDQSGPLALRGHGRKGGRHVRAPGRRGVRQGQHRLPHPRPIEILAHSPVVCEGRPSHQDTAYYTVPSGAGVFATGTMRWVEALDATGDGRSGANHGLDARSGALTTRVTENLLRVFASRPRGQDAPGAGQREGGVRGFGLLRPEVLAVGQSECTGLRP